jgi:hypothetical protein
MDWPVETKFDTSKIETVDVSAVEQLIDSSISQLFIQ